jgi:MFS family permease
MLLRYLRSLTVFERDARLFLLVTLASGSAVSLWWIDFNLYLRSLGVDLPVIGLVTTVGSAASLLVAFPASIVSDRIGRRLVLLAGAALMTAAFGGLLSTSALPALLLAAAAFAAGSGAMQVVSQPFLAEHSRAEERSELFAVQFAISNGTNVIAALAGGSASRRSSGPWQSRWRYAIR